MKKVLFLVVLVIVMTFGASAYTIGAAEFSVPLAESQAQALSELGLLKGTGNGFELDTEMTRAEAVTMLVRFIGGEGEALLSSANSGFVDVDDTNHWSRCYVGYAKRNALTDGTSAQTFSPDDGVTGRQFAKFILSALGYTGVTLDNAFEKAEAAGIIANNYIKAAVFESDYIMKRNDLVYLSYAALLGQRAGGGLQYEYLIEKGVFTREAFEKNCLSVDPKAADFCWDLYSLMPKNENYMVSPLSIKTALAMTANGADGVTQSEMTAALGISDLAEFNKSIAALIKRYKETKTAKLSLANSIWLNSDYAPGADFSKSFEKLVGDYYDGASESVTNKNAVSKINGWVSRTTKEKIKEIIDSSDFLACLVNSVYFKASWAEQFNAKATAESDFKTADGKTVKKDFMHNTGYYKYYADKDVRIIELPYEGYELSMYVAIGSCSGKTESIVKDGLMKSTYVSLSLPKFKVEFKTELNDVLKTLGIKKAFTDNAEFGGMFTGLKAGSCIDKVLHKTYVSVDENGTEAAAVTAVMVKATGMFQTPEPVLFTADEPFTWFIRDNISGELLFIGEIIK